MAKTSFTPFPTLTTDRLVLRQLETADAKPIFLHRSDDVVNTYLEDFRHSSIEETQAFIERVQREIAEGRTILWVLTEKGNNDFLGTICLWNISWNEQKAETGYTMDPKFHGLGYMNEAMAAILDFGFNKMGLNTIDAYTHEHNKNSVKLLRRNGFKQGIPKKEVGKNRIYFWLSSEIHQNSSQIIKIPGK
jgi:ribosomal-protein-alanine N-acetyltransferase